METMDLLCQVFVFFAEQGLQLSPYEAISWNLAQASHTTPAPQLSSRRCAAGHPAPLRSAPLVGVGGWEPEPRGGAGAPSHKLPALPPALSLPSRSNRRGQPARCPLAGSRRRYRLAASSPGRCTRSGSAGRDARPLTPSRQPLTATAP